MLIFLKPFDGYKIIVICLLLVKYRSQPGADRARPGIALQAISAGAVMLEVGFQA